MKQTRCVQAGLILVVAGLSLVRAQPVDPLSGFLSGAGAETGMMEPHATPLAPGDELLPELAELPSGPQPAELEERSLPDRPEPGAEGMAPDAGMAQLTAEQRRKLAEQRIKFLKQAGPLNTELRIKQVELSLLWLDDELNEDKIVAKAKEVQRVKEQLEELRLRQRIALMKILPLEQRRMMPIRGFRGMGRGRRGGRAGQGLMRGANRQY
jgi:Spy/CpxP family protein refolding chaperone